MESRLNPNALSVEQLKAQVSEIQAAITAPREAKPVITDMRAIQGEAQAKSLRIVMEERYSVRYRLTPDYRLFALEVSGVDADQLTSDAEGKAKQDASGGRSSQAFR